MSIRWVTQEEVRRIAPRATLTSKRAKKIKVTIAGSDAATPHVWRSRKEARKWAEGLATVPVWRKGVFNDYLYEGVTLGFLNPALEVPDDEVAFEGDPLDPPNDFLDAATTFEVPTEASVADLIDPKAHAPIREVLSTESERRLRFGPPVDSAPESIAEAATRIASDLEKKLARIRGLDLDESDKALLVEQESAIACGLVCEETVFVGETEYACFFLEGHEGPHKDIDEGFEWGHPQFFEPQERPIIQIPTGTSVDEEQWTDGFEDYLDKLSEDIPLGGMY